jgi:uncharacterized protein (DUF305 family)
MSEPALILPAARREAVEPAPSSVRWVWLAVAAALLAVLAIGAVWLWSQRPPGDTSVEAGFARDMIVHHEQAVTMALLARDGTSDPAIRSLATDILLTQQNQIGQMLGWLNVWGLPATGQALPMAWMGHQTTGLMPGMASPKEMENLARLSGPALDAEFLRLMIRHHQGGIPMADAALARGDNGAVRDLARAIVVSQEAEIAIKEELLREREAPDVAS